MDVEYNHLDRQTDISFCLPVYNVKPYLDDCLQSIVNQNLENSNIAYEIFCIDDGSKDGSYEFLLDKAKAISQLRVEKNEDNKGVSYTRNRLMCEAKGKYIWFVDPDDMIYGEVAVKLIDLIEKCDADIVLANYTKIDAHEKYKKKGNLKFGEIEYKVVTADTWDWLPDRAGESRMFSLWRGIFKKKFLLDNKLFLNEKVVLMEDALLYYELKWKNPIIVKVELCCYQVRQRPGSAMRATEDIDRQKRIFESTKNLIYTYQTYAYCREEIEMEAEQKIYSLVKQAILLLSRIKDKAYVKEGIKELKAKKLYPKFLKNTNGYSAREKVMFFLLRTPMGIAIINFLYRIKKK